MRGATGSCAAALAANHEGKTMRMMNLRGALCVLVAGMSAAASAQTTCPTPTLSQCVDATYRGGTCYPTHRTYCTNLIDSEWNRQVPAMPQRMMLLPDSLGGTVARVGVAPPIRPTTSNFVGLRSQVASLVAVNQILYRKGFNNLSPDEAKHAADLTAWQTNGTTIRSCREYVHEKYLDYSKFEAAEGARAADFRAVFNDAYGPNGIANRKLYSSSGKQLAPIFDGTSKVEKNAYFRFVPGPYPANQAKYQFSNVALKANNPSARQFFASTDALHTQLSQTLANHNDDVLNEETGRQLELTTLLAKRASVWASYQALVANKPKQSLKGVETETATALRAIDKSIDEALKSADTRGCLNAQQVTACDWSPRRYHEMVHAQMDSRRQRDLTQCLRLTADDFSPSSFVRNAQLSKVNGLSGDYTLSPELLDGYLVAYGGSMDSADVPTDPSTGITRRSERTDDGGEFGDRSSFAARIDYGAGWEAEWGTRFCDAEVGIDGYVELSGWALGNGQQIARAEGSIATDDDNIVLDIAVSVFGSEVYTNELTQPAMLDFQVADWSIVEDTLRWEQPFVIVFVPVTISAGLAAGVGIEFRLGGQVRRTCSAVDSVGIDLLGTAKPYARLEGFASIALGFPGLRVGIRGEILIARVDLPLRGSVGVYVNDLGDVSLMIGLSLALQQRYLDGSIKVFGELGPCPFCVRGSFAIAEWTGFGGEEIPLWEERWDVPLARL